MSRSNALETGILELLFENSVPANEILDDISDGIGASPTAGSLFVSLHTANPGEAGDQTTSEAAYTGYARVAVARSGAGWTVAGNQVTNAAEIAFPASTSSETVQFFGIGTDSTGAGNLLYSGPLGPTADAFIACGEASSDVITAYGHNLVADDQVVFFAVPGATLPAGITEGTKYHVIAPVVASTSFKISTSQGGGAVDITADGAGLVQRLVELAISNGVTPKFAAGDLLIEAD